MGWKTLGRLCAAFLLVGLFSLRAHAESTTTCAPGQYDMLDWLTLDSDLRGSYYMVGDGSVPTNPIYTFVGTDRFWWVKDPTGKTWDINRFDDNWIYWWVTQSVWNDSTSWMQASSDFNMKAIPRCAYGGFPGSLHQDSDTSTDHYTSCVYQSTTNIGGAGFSVWGPYNLSHGGSIPDNTPTLIIGYSWGCDPVTFANCTNKEEYYLTQRYGLVRWEAYQTNSSGQETLVQSVPFNVLTSGTTSVDSPCL